MKLNAAPTKLVSDLCQSQGGLSLHSIPLHLENEDKIHSENGTNYWNIINNQIIQELVNIFFQNSPIKTFCFVLFC